MQEHGVQETKQKPDSREFRRRTLEGEEVDVKEEADSPTVPEPNPLSDEELEQLLRWMLEEAPSDILTNISEWFSDEEKWQRRTMCKTFYNVYYNQKIHEKNYEQFNFNGKRAVILARKFGRVFKRVKGLDIYHALEFSMTDDDLRAINVTHFPCLEALWIRGKSTTSKEWDDPLRNTSLEHLCHPKMSFLQVRPAHPRDLRWITEDRFPNLERLRIYHKSKLEVLPNHSKIISISPRLPLDYTTWELISRAKFPRLRRIKVKQHDLQFDKRMISYIKQQYRLEGIELQCRATRMSQAVPQHPNEMEHPPPLIMEALMGGAFLAELQGQPTEEGLDAP